MTGHDVTNESHREGCAECRAVWADLERISAEARVLPRLSPSRDLWAGIEARIGGAGEHKDRTAAAEARAHRRWFANPTIRLATAASLLIAATATITWQVATGRAPDAPVIATTAVAAPDDSLIPNLAAGDPGMSQPARLRAAANATDFSRMDTEIGALRVIVNERLGQLDPATVQVLERSLTLIDQAIADSRAALLADPMSPFLANELARAYTSKLDLLRTTAKLPAGT